MSFSFHAYSGIKCCIHKRNYKKLFVAPRLQSTNKALTGLKPVVRDLNQKSAISLSSHWRFFLNNIYSRNFTQSLFIIIIVIYMLGKRSRLIKNSFSSSLISLFDNHAY
ncbi:hypothetical protein RCL_jg19403.t1 [Rhizophagus clarus]|uniref:Uncharacterized protein n=1 Tax=Rhizophagus clarus TaxID=94130 RepID=A0A8H3QW32_9GLOM|nr:hypothetical protein RCL_jg19403.t1 [Rhizophagus clarus]